MTVAVTAAALALTTIWRSNSMSPPTPTTQPILLGSKRFVNLYCIRRELL